MAPIGLKGFSLGGAKSKFQKEKEKAEQRKKKEEEEAAKVFSDFCASFEADDSKEGSQTQRPSKSGFVRGDVVNADPASAPNPGGPAPGQVYQMLPKAAAPVEAPRAPYVPPPEVKAPPPEREREREREMPIRDRDREREREREERPKEEEKRERRSSRSSLSSSSSSKKRSIDQLMAELKDGTVPAASKSRRCDDSGGRDERTGSFDEGDPETTNLYVGNLHPQTSEEVLMKLYGKYGPVSSVKVMWPRSDEEKARQKMSGFVNMMHRRDAEAAKDALQNKELIGLEMRIGWGKAMPKGPVPIYTHTEGAKDEVSNQAPRADIIVRMPQDSEKRQLIDKLAVFVSRMGPEFERAVITRERGNPDFAFLWEPESRDAVYYKWRVFTLTQSDSLFEWRRSAFQMFMGGVTWIPPKDDDVDAPRHRSRSRDRGDRRDRGVDRDRDRPRSRSRDRSRGRHDRHDRDGRGDMSRRSRSRSRSRSRDRDEGHGASLSDAERDKLETALRRMSAERADVGDAMVFALSRAEAAFEIVDCITESLTILETPIPSKIARLFLVSDILHNSSAAIKKASLFRSCFEKVMPEVFEALGDKLRSQDVGRMTAEAMREKVTRVLRVWEVWSIYPIEFISKLETLFLGTAQAGGAPDIDGQPLEADLDGEELDGDALDGEPLESGENLDGEPIKDKEEDEEEENGYDPNLPVSKWNQPPDKKEGSGSDDEEGYNPNLPISKWNKPPEA